MNDPYHIVTTEEKQALDPLIKFQGRIKWNDILPLVPGLSKQQCINYVNSKRNPRKHRSGASKSLNGSTVGPTCLRPTFPWHDQTSNSNSTHKQVLPQTSSAQTMDAPQSVGLYFEREQILQVQGRGEVEDSFFRKQIRYLLFMMQTDAFYEYQVFKQAKSDPIVQAAFYFQNRYTKEQIEAVRRYSQHYCPNFHVFEKFGGIAAHSTVLNQEKSLEQIQIAQIAYQIQLKIRNCEYLPTTTFQTVIEEILAEDLIVCDAVVDLLQKFKAYQILQRRTETHIHFFGATNSLELIVGSGYVRDLAAGLKAQSI